MKKLKLIKQKGLIVYLMFLLMCTVGIISCSHEQDQNLKQHKLKAVSMVGQPTADSKIAKDSIIYLINGQQNAKAKINEINARQIKSINIINDKRNVNGLQHIDTVSITLKANEGKHADRR